MLDIEPIGPLRFNVDLSYRDSGGVDSLRRVTVQQLDLNPPASISGVCHLRRARRSFRIDRIVQLICPVTGEVPDRLTSWFKDRASGPQDGVLPEARKHTAERSQAREISQVVFKDGWARGWAFGVSAAFKSALDISLSRRLLTERSPLIRQLKAHGIAIRPSELMVSEAARAVLIKSLIDAAIPATRIDTAIEDGQPPKPAVWIEMQGSPPNFDFSAGDIFYCPPPSAGEAWGAYLQVLEYSIQVISEEFDRVEVEVRRYEGGDWISTAICEISQGDLVELLQFGIYFSPRAILKESNFKNR